MNLNHQKNKGLHNRVRLRTSGEKAYGVPSRVSPRAFFLLWVLFVFWWVEVSAGLSITFSDSSLVNDTAIRLGDIAQLHGDDGALTRELEARIIGQAAPPGFARYVGHYEAVRYAVTSRFPTVELPEPTTGRTRVVTDYRTAGIDDYRDRILDYLATTIEWVPQDYTVDIENADETWRCHNHPFTVRVEGLTDPRPRGHVRLWLVVTQMGKERRVMVRCRVKVTAAVLVAAGTIRRGEPISAAAIRKERRDITSLRFVPLTEPTAVSKVRAVRTLTPGTVLHDRCVEKMPLIYRDDLVYVTTQAGNVRVSVRARARESGGLGDLIWVQNLNSRKLLRVKVRGKEDVRVERKGAL
ncbi:MAG: flagellar basal body P-ring formation protein FlgA [Chitinivibrionales bacterium]|nr:flagellar basal body P-ring formation protein FlgA [Chitinivibrionales bacterium]MBD3357956.1 flagellar basal body P-ring formation protein FlgA [Chitinivibrionales bacterium]